MDTVVNSPLRALTVATGTDPPGPRYVCFPPAGGTAAMFRSLAAARPGAQLLVVQYPARADRLGAQLSGNVEELAQRCADELVAAPASERTRTVLIGVGMGALLALETALQWDWRHGCGPCGLVVVGATAPHRRGPRHRLPADAELNRMVDDGGWGESVLREHVRGLLRADLRLVSRYTGPARHGAPCRIAALCGEDDPRYVEDDATGAWAVWSRSPFASCVVRGGHLGLLTPERAGEFWQWMDRLALPNAVLGEEADARAHH
ncbi:thioesterase II family protein [Streptomyces sp. NPDC090442]|uniref:thioesterase II family protein n=1 Tax=Streptomyces sp. NPDC090442 TaxID=3365962 RepID=UPI003803B887